MARTLPLLMMALACSRAVADELPSDGPSSVATVDASEAKPNAETSQDIVVQLQLSAGTQELIERYPVCLQLKCPAAVGPLNTMVALRPLGDLEGIKRVACAHEDAFTCLYRTSNLWACYGFVTYQDWGGYAVPLPLTSWQLRQQCRSRMSLAAADASVAKEELEPAASEEQQEQQEDAQIQGFHRQDALFDETLVQSQLSTGTQELIQRYPACFEQTCPAAVAPLNAMVALRRSGDLEGIKRVACAHQDAFMCMYRTSNLWACYGFVTSQDWGGYSVPVPLTSVLLRQQCGSIMSVAAVNVLEAKSAETTEEREEAVVEEQHVQPDGVQNVDVDPKDDAVVVSAKDQVAGVTELMTQPAILLP